MTIEMISIVKHKAKIYEAKERAFFLLLKNPIKLSDVINTIKG